MSKKLYLLRHAQALSTDAGGRDDGRHLSPKGLADARALGAVMKDKKYRPRTVICSDAVRVRETLGCVMETIPIPYIQEEHILYTGDRGDYLSLIQGLDDKHDSALIVGHNPSIHGLAMILVGEQSSDTLMSQLATSYMPATLSVFECDCESWADLQPAKNDLVDLMSTQDYNAPQTPARWM